MRGKDKLERLDKLLCADGARTRKQAHELICAGRVTVNGERVQKADLKFDERADIRIGDTPVSGVRHVYLMMNKPQDVISSTEDPREKTVLDLLPEAFRRIGIFPVGRLDKDAEGLLLLSNDGALAHRLLAPGKHDKKYFVRVEGNLTQADCAAFAAGITLKDGYHCLAAKLELLSEPDQAFVTVQEGKYHQVKRMLASRGKPVRALKRIAMGRLVLDETLPSGGWRRLNSSEKDLLGV